MNSSITNSIHVIYNNSSISNDYDDMGDFKQSSSSDNINNFSYNCFSSNNSICSSTDESSQHFPVEDELRERVYRIMMPILVVFLLASALTSATVLLSIPWLKRPVSPIVRLSLSLSAANTAFSCVVAGSIIVHSYLPFVHHIEIHRCVQLTVEVVRMSIIVVQVYHLLAVALVHYWGVVRPLHYASRLTSSRVKAIVAGLWGLPHLCMVTGFALVPGQGYQSPNCQDCSFYLHGVTFRLVWTVVILAPTVALLAVYARIFSLLRDRAPSMVTEQQRKTLKRSVKTVTTTALIVGTFIVGWFPAAVTFLLVCRDCLVPALHSRPLQLALFSSNYIIFIIKVFADTFIYVVGLRDVREAVWKLYFHVKTRCCRVGCQPRDRNIRSPCVQKQHRYFSSMKTCTTASTPLSSVKKSTSEKKKMDVGVNTTGNTEVERKIEKVGDMNRQKSVSGSCCTSLDRSRNDTHVDGECHKKSCTSKNHCIIVAGRQTPSAVNHLYELNDDNKSSNLKTDFKKDNLNSFPLLQM